MNIFELLRGSFGKECVKTLRHLERLERTRARHKNHLRFNLRCRDEDITPASLNIKNPIHTKNAEKIIKRAQKDLVKERIKTTGNKIERITEQTKVEKDNFKRIFPIDQDTQTKIDEYLEIIYEQELKKTKTRQLNKLQKLIERKNGNKKTYMETNEKWVRNLSQRTLTETEKRILTRGLNFAITPKKHTIRRLHTSNRIGMSKNSRPGTKI